MLQESLVTYTRWRTRGNWAGGARGVRCKCNFKQTSLILIFYWLHLSCPVSDVVSTAQPLPLLAQRAGNGVRLVVCRLWFLVIFLALSLVSVWLHAKQRLLLVRNWPESSPMGACSRLTGHKLAFSCFMSLDWSSETWIFHVNYTTRPPPSSSLSSLIAVCYRAIVIHLLLCHCHHC